LPIVSSLFDYYHYATITPLISLIFIIRHYFTLLAHGAERCRRERSSVIEAHYKTR